MYLYLFIFNCTYLYIFIFNCIYLYLFVFYSYFNLYFNFISIIRKQLSNQQLSDENLYTEDNFLNSITQELYKKTSIELEGKLKNIKSFPIYISKKMEISNNKNIFFLINNFIIVFIVK